MRFIKASGLTLYHGTTRDNAESIKLSGLKKGNLGPRWFMLADNREDAVFHAHGDAVVVEFSIPDVQDENELNPWVWPAEKVSKGHWYALRKDLPAEFVVGIKEI